MYFARRNDAIAADTRKRIESLGIIPDEITTRRAESNPARR
jgi:hypothetical protein